VNEEGYAITCKHVIDILGASDNLNKKFIEYKNERSKIPQDGKFKRAMMGLELKYNYTNETLIQIKHNFIDCIDKMSGFTWHVHPKYDLAILKFNDFEKTLYTGFAKFLKDSSKIKQGSFLCRLSSPILNTMKPRMILNGQQRAFRDRRGFLLKAWLQDSWQKIQNNFLE
jgi:hypothetical protein